MRPIYIIFCVAGIFIGIFGSVMVMTHNQPATPDREGPVTAKDRMEQLRSDANKRTREDRDQKAIGAGLQILDSLEVGIEAEEIIEKLKTVKIDSPKHIQRRIIHYFESLVDLDEEAIPAIQAFLNESVDLDFTKEKFMLKYLERNNASLLLSDDSRIQQRVNRSDVSDKDKPGQVSFFKSLRPLPDLKRLIMPKFTLPYSMRFGMFEVLYRIGGKSAEDALLEALGKTVRGVEVALLDAYLESMMDGHNHRGFVLKAVKEVLADDPVIPDPTNIDHNSKLYLYSLLVKYNDKTQVNFAKKNIINSSGRLNPFAVKLLIASSGPDAMEHLHSLYTGGRLENQWDKRTLREMSLPYTGYNNHANNIMVQAIKDAQYRNDKYTEKDVILALNGAVLLPEGTDRFTVDLAVMENRLNLLKQLKPIINPGNKKANGRINQYIFSINHLLETRKSSKQ